MFLLDKYTGNLCYLIKKPNLSVFDEKRQKIPEQTCNSNIS